MPQGVHHDSAHSADRCTRTCVRKLIDILLLLASRCVFKICTPIVSSALRTVNTDANGRDRDVSTDVSATMMKYTIEGFGDLDILFATKFMQKVFLRDRCEHL